MTYAHFIEENKELRARLAEVEEALGVERAGAVTASINIETLAAEVAEVEAERDTFRLMRDDLVIAKERAERESETNFRAWQGQLSKCKAAEARAEQAERDRDAAQQAEVTWQRRAGRAWESGHAAGASEATEAAAPIIKTIAEIEHEDDHGCKVCLELLDHPENDNGDGEWLGHTIDCPVALAQEWMEGRASTHRKAPGAHEVIEAVREFVCQVDTVAEAVGSGMMEPTESPLISAEYVELCCALDRLDAATHRKGDAGPALCESIHPSKGRTCSLSDGHAGDHLSKDGHRWTEPVPTEGPGVLTCDKPVIMGHGNDYQCERPEGHAGQCGPPCPDCGDTQRDADGDICFRCFVPPTEGPEGDAT